MSPAAASPAISTLNDLTLLIAERNAPEVMRYKRDGEWHSLSAAEALRQIVRVARGLQRMGVAPGDRIALLSENRPEWALADFAILGCGAVNVPLYTTLPAESCEYILRNSGASVMFVSSKALLEKVRSVWDKLPELKHAIVFDRPAGSVSVFSSNVAAAGGPPREMAWKDLVGDPMLATAEIAHFEKQARAVKPDDLASIIYTSGTTGTPKGVMLTHHNIVSNIIGAPVEVIGPSDLALSFLPLSHIYERTADYVYLYYAVPIAYAESIDAVAQNLLEIRPTVAAAVPRLFEKVYARVLEKISKASWPRRKLFWWGVAVGREALKRRIAGQPVDGALALKYKIADALVFRKLRARLGGRLRYFVSGSAPLAPELAEFFNAIGVPVCEGYGLTETSPVVAANVPSSIRPGTVGRPLRNVEVRIADDGEILVRGPNVMKGYYNLPEETARTIVDGWLHTGDIGEFTPDGCLRVTDRKKDLLKTAGGKFIAPQPIENRLRQSRWISNAVVVGDRRPYAVALIVPNFERLADFARERGIVYSSPSELARHEAVRELIQRELDAINAHLAHFETIKRFLLLDRDFSIDSGELTPTLKVRRRIVEQQLRDRIEALYADAATATAHKAS